MKIHTLLWSKFAPFRIKVPISFFGSTPSIDGWIVERNFASKVPWILGILDASQGGDCLTWLEGKVGGWYASWKVRASDRSWGSTCWLGQWDVCLDLRDVHFLHNVGCHGFQWEPTQFILLAHIVLQETPWGIYTVSGHIPTMHVWRSETQVDPHCSKLPEHRITFVELWRASCTCQVGQNVWSIGSSVHTETVHSIGSCGAATTTLGRWHSFYVLVYMGPLLTHLLTAVPSILTLRHALWHHAFQLSYLHPDLLGEIGHVSFAMKLDQKIISFVV